MTRKVRDVMSRHPVMLPRTAPLTDAARQMKESEIGDVLVVDDGNLCGVVTDRDIVVKAVAEGRDPSSVKLEEICSQEVIAVKPDDPVDRAVQLMRQRAVRRLAVVQDGAPVGVISLGDLAIELDEDSGLAEISAAEPNN